MDLWPYFFQAQVGASATLLGLIFVSVSINLTKILASPHLPTRAFQALLVLLQILMVSSLMLVPQPASFTAIEILVVSLAAWGGIGLRLDIGAIRTAEAPYRRHSIFRMLLSQLAALLFIGAGAAMLMHVAYGIDILVPAILFSYLVAVIDAWVLLIEINR